MYMCVGVGRLFHEDKGRMEGGKGCRGGMKSIAEERPCAEALTKAGMHACLSE